MASSLQTGLTAASYQRYLRGPGKLYYNFTSMASRGTLLGATKGGTEFSWGLEAFDIMPDGSLGLIKNHRVVNSCKPTMKINLFEWTAANLLRSVPGGNSADMTPTIIDQYLGVGTSTVNGVGLTYGTVGGAVDESTLEVWKTVVSGLVPTKLTLDTHYAMVDTITLVSATTSDAVVVGGVTYTAGTTESLSTNQFIVAAAGTAGDYAAATSLAACIDSATYGTTSVDASSSAGVVYCTRATAGTPTTITEAAGSITLDFQVVLEITGIADTDIVTAKYTYDATDSGDAYTVVTPGIIADGDYWDNVALVCELSNQSYTNPYMVYIVKNCLPAPDPVTIPGEYPGETVLSMLIEGSFDPADGLTMDYAPVEAWIGIA